MSVIKLEDVKKIYHMGDNSVYALNGVSLTIDRGEFVAIMGPSGSGKSTLMHILGLLDVPTQGRYFLSDKAAEKLTEDELSQFRREQIGFIFQQFNLLPRLSALENVVLPQLYSEKSMNFAWGEKLLNQVGLGSRKEHHPNQLSGGQQQRVAIARSLVNRPQIILADEPTGNLDSQSEKDVLAMLTDLNDQGLTVIIVTHEEDIAAHAKRVIRMRDGVIQSDETKIQKRIETPKLAKEKTKFLWFTPWIEHIRQGIKTLAANKVRSFLSMLGILIGVASVVAMLALGRGAQKQIEAQLTSLGSNLLVLRSGSVRGVGGAMQESGVVSRLQLDDAAQIQEKVPNVRRVAANASGHVQINYKAQNWPTNLLGSDSTYADMRASVPAFGRFFTDEETQKRLRVVVIGMTLVRQLFGNTNPIGETIKINKINFQVIGVLPEKGANSFRDQDDIVVIPVTTAMFRVLGKRYPDNIDIEISGPQFMDEAQDKVLELMLSRRRIPPSQQSNAFEVRNMADIQNAIQQTSQTMTLLLSVIAAISLFVGGIGIMNIMLVSVTERTREIGLRKAVGAEKKDILIQFLIESIVISTLGGFFGIVLAWLVSQAISTFTGWATSVSPSSIVVAVLFSAFVGIVFGVYPAKKASELNPIDALRYE